MQRYAVMTAMGPIYIHAHDFDVKGGLLAFYRDDAPDPDEPIVAYAAGQWVGVSNTVFDHGDPQRDPAPPDTEEPGQVAGAAEG